MKVLFVSSGNSKNGISTIIKSQGESLKNNGIDISYFTIKGKGFFGYLKNIFPLSNYINQEKPDIVHSHYSLSAFIASLSLFGKKVPHVVSLMGSDTHLGHIWRFLTVFCMKYLWAETIVKSVSMKKLIGSSIPVVISNGVNLSLFKPIEKDRAKSIVKFDKTKKSIIWVSNPKRYEKNILLANEAIKLVEDKEIDFKIIYGVDHSDIYQYLYAADLLLLTSRWEGSPNIIKEAMACNLPIVSTKVGDVEWLLNGLDGCYTADFDAEDLSHKIEKALEFSKNVGPAKGRERLLELGLDSNSIAIKIIKIYNMVMQGQV